MTEQRSHLGDVASAVETVTDGISRWDFRTAHHRAGDTGNTQWLPESCTRCWHQAQAAEEQGRPEPTAPDQEWVSDEPT